MATMANVDCWYGNGMIRVNDADNWYDNGMTMVTSSG